MLRFFKKVLLCIFDSLFYQEFISILTLHDMKILSQMAGPGFRSLTGSKRVVMCIPRCRKAALTAMLI
jgi:hypothetical protein